MNRGGRVLGIVVFVLGIAILIFVFGLAYSMFTAPASEVFGGSPDSPATVTSLGTSIALMVVRIGLLFVMTLAGSLVAARGIGLYLGSGEPGQSGRHEDQV